LAEASDYGFAGFFEKIKGSAADKRLAHASFLEELAFEKPETLFVGDHVHEIEAGRAAGTATAAVVSRYSSRRLLEEARPDYLLDSLKDVLDIASE